MTTYDYEENVVPNEEDLDDHPFAPVSLSTLDVAGEVVEWSDEEAEQEDLFSVPTTDNFFRFTWFHGYNPIMLNSDEPLTDENGNKICIKGLAIPVNSFQGDMPTNLKEALNKLVAQKKATLLSVQHESGEVKKYYQLADDSYAVYPLFIGLPRYTQYENDIIPLSCYNQNNPTAPQLRNLLGVVAGRKTRVNKEQLVQNTYNFCSCLLVVDSLWEAGYVNEQGLPIPLCFEGTNYGCMEFYRVLEKQTKVVDAARRIDPVKWGKAEPWQFGVYLRHNNKRIPHVNLKTKKGSDAHEVVAQFPQQFDKAYLDKMWVGNKKDGAKKLQALKQLLYVRVRRTDGSYALVAGGTAVKWCRDTAEFCINQQRQKNPNTLACPKGELQYGKDKPLSPRLMRMYAQTAQNPSVLEERPTTARRNPPVRQQQYSAPVEEYDGDEEEYNEDAEITRKIDDYLQFFKRVRDTDNIAAMETLQQQWANAEVPMEEVAIALNEAESAKQERVRAARKAGFRAPQQRSR
jgi:hypothetical protein